VTLAVRATVVSFSHELLVELFRTRGELAPTLLRLCKGMVIDHERAEQRSIDLSQVMPTEYRADAVVVLHDRRDAIVAAVIVEVQLNVDRDKERTWPVYVTALHHKLACPVVLVVVTPSDDVARWARQPIEIGHPGLCLVPVVVELKNVPRVVDPAQVQAIPELGVLSAMANPDLEVATTALDAASRLPEDRAKLCWDVILAALPPSVRKALEAQMQGYVYQSEFARKYYSQGHEKGLEEGLEQGLSQGLRRAVLALVRARLHVVTSEEEAMIDAVRDARALSELLDALVRATSTLEVRAALDAARSGG
jgi:hypothetical protein